MFDVYFSDKNKLYRKKDIEFDHRTWKDFCSSLNDGRLQDRYNAYIRECDLVIFLFHTRLGKYTREELEVALAAFHTLGHFCDVYTTPEDWRVKFDRQLAILEQEGVIRAPSTEEKMLYRLKFTLSYVVAPLIVMWLAFKAFFYFTPVTTTVCLSDQTVSALPFEGADITLTYSDKSETCHVDRLTDEAIFKEIHSRYLGTPVQLSVTAKGYEPVDTVMELEKRLVVNIRRDQSLSVVFGTVKDEANRPLSGVIIQVIDLQTVSDEMGNFRLSVPLDKQQVQQRVQAFKKGYELWDFTGPVSDKIPWKIILRK